MQNEEAMIVNVEIDETSLQTGLESMRSTIATTMVTINSEVTSYFAGLIEATTVYTNIVEAVNAVESIAAGLKTASTAATVIYATAQNVLAGSLTLAEGAQMALNVAMETNPAGILVVGIGALVAGMSALFSIQGSCATESEREIQLLKEKREKIVEELNAYEEKKLQREDELQGSLAQINNTRKLTDELGVLVDVNGKIKEGEEGRVSFILGEYNSAMGTEYTIVDGVIQKYDELCGSINASIEQLRAKAILDSMKQDYDDAVSNLDGAVVELNNLYENKTQAEENYSNKFQEYQQLINDGRYEEAAQMSSEVASLKYHLDEQNSAYANQLNSVEIFLKDKAAYEDNYELYSENKYSDMKTREMQELSNDNETEMGFLREKYNAQHTMFDENEKLKNDKQANADILEMERIAGKGIETAASQGLANDAELSTLDMFIANKQQKLTDMYTTDKSNWTEAQVQEAADLQRSIDLGLNTYQKYVEEKVAKAQELTNNLNENSTQQEKDEAISARKAASDTLGIYAKSVSDKIERANYLKAELDNNNEAVTQDMVDEAQNQARRAGEEFGVVANNTITGLNSRQADAVGIGANYTEGFISGVSSLCDKAKSAASYLGTVAMEALRNIGFVKSPSRKMREIGSYYGKGFVLGIDDERLNVRKKADRLGNSVLEATRALSSDMESAFDPALEMTSIFNDKEIHGMLLPLQEAIEAEQLRMAAGIEASFYKDIMLTQQPVVNVAGDNFAIDYKKMGKQIVEAIHKSGISVKYDRREFGRIVKGVNV